MRQSKPQTTQTDHKDLKDKGADIQIERSTSDDFNMVNFSKDVHSASLPKKTYIKFQYPIQIGKEAFEQYVAAGLCFGSFKMAREYHSSGFTAVEVTVAHDRLAQNLSKLGYEAIYNLEPHLYKSELGPILDKATSLWQLQRMTQTSESSYPFSFFGL